MLDSLTITAPAFADALDFYDAVLGSLGLVRLHELVDEEEDEPVLEAVGWGPADGTNAGISEVWVVAGVRPTTGLHLRLRADSRAQVETFHAVGVEHGGATFSAPRRWPIYRRGEFNAIVRDPLGNLLEAISPE